jgi:hypothetical protein
MKMGTLGFRFHCSFCDEALNGQGYKLMGYRYDELKVISAHYYRLCRNCYRKIDYALRQTLVKIRIAKLQETWGHVKQDTAVKI